MGYGLGATGYGLVHRGRHPSLRAAHCSPAEHTARHVKVSQVSQHAMGIRRHGIRGKWACSDARACALYHGTLLYGTMVQYRAYHGKVSQVSKHAMSR